MAIALKSQYTEIVKMFNILRGKYQLWEIWQDAITLYACEISNAVDSRYREEREAQYMRIIRKYSRHEAAVFPHIFAEIVEQLERDPEQDFLGDLYMQLELGSHWHGQFFTPYSVCQAMAEINFKQEITEASEVKPVTVCDPACGGGATLIAAAHAFRRSIRQTGLNPQHYLCIFAQDISPVVAMMCYVQISLQGYAGKIKIGDTLLHPLTDMDNGADIWYTPMWFSPIWEARRLANRLDKIMMGGKHYEG